MTSEQRAPMVKVGEPVPEFAGETDSGGAISRTDLLGHPSVVFFYPKAGSMGCSIESREFARLFDEFRAAGVKVVGVSVDRAEAQREFRQGCALPFELVADHDGKISARFGVLGRLGLARRTTFVIGADGRVVKVLRTWRPGGHARPALEAAAGERRVTPDTPRSADQRDR